MDKSLKKTSTLIDELEAIVKSLYWDQIKPTEADIQHRLSELYPSRSNVHVETLIGSIASSFSSSMTFEQDETGKWFVKLLVCPTWFNGWLDPCATDAWFEQDVWDGLNHFLACLCTQAPTAEADLKPYQFKGGRYGLSRVLQDRILTLYQVDRDTTCIFCDSFLELIQFYSLGRLCQLVQTGIYRGILRYEDNLLQPIACCPTPSAAFANKLLPVKPACDTVREVGSLEELSQCIYELFCVEEVVEFPLSQLKKRILCNFQLILNPVSLGFVKLSDALKSIDGVELVVKGNNAIIMLSGFTPSTTYSRGA